jgi:hypothetical protein
MRLGLLPGIAAASAGVALAGVAGAQPYVPAHPAAITGIEQLNGQVIAYDGTSATIRVSGTGSRVIGALDHAADAVTNGDYPYVWGGGHASAGSASAGIPGPGHNSRRRGFDCSGAVAAVLAGAGLWPAGAGVPNDAGIIQTLRGERLIRPGVGVGLDEVTLYDDPGVHIFMNIAGRFFGTSDGGAGNPAQQRDGAGWLDDGAGDASSRAFHAWHFVPRVTGNAPTALTVELGQEAPMDLTLQDGDRIAVRWQELVDGEMVADSVALSGARQATGTVASLGAATLAVTTASGQTLDLSPLAGGSATAGLSVGEPVSVVYTVSGTTLLLRGVQLTGPPAPPSGTTTMPTAPVTSTAPPPPMAAPPQGVPPAPTPAPGTATD